MKIKIKSLTDCWPHLTRFSVKIKKAEEGLEITFEDKPNYSILNKSVNNNMKINVDVLSSICLTNCYLYDLPLSFRILNLKHLNLAHNRLRAVPNCFYCGLNYLKTLDLSYNSITNFDIQPGCNDNLISLKINDNKLSNLPWWILSFNCSKLEVLIYSRNKVESLRVLSQTYPYRLNIKKLEMCNAVLNDGHIMFFKNLTNLEYLDIGNNELNTSSNHFRNINNLFNNPRWSKIETIKLNNLFLSIVPRNLCYIQSLKQLDLVNCDLNYLPRELKYLTNLEYVDVSHNKLSSINDFNQCKKLKVLKISSNNVEFIHNVPSNIKCLDLYDNFLKFDENYNLISAELLDLDWNFFDTELLNNSEYGMKRNNLRTKTNELDRRIGLKSCREIDEDIPNDDITTTSEDIDYDTCSMDKNIESNNEYCSSSSNVSNSDNCWDYIGRNCVQAEYIRNPDISSSDEEWNGYEHFYIARQKIANSFDNEYADWSFCNAEDS